MYTSTLRTIKVKVLCYGWSTLGPNSTNHLCMRTTNFLMDEDDEVQNEHIRSDKK